MTNGGSVNFCLRESSIKVSQLLTVCYHFKVEFMDTLPYLSYSGTLCLPQGPGVETPYYNLHVAPSPVRRFRDIWHYSHSNTVIFQVVGSETP